MLSPRARAIVAAAREILEREGPGGLTMRRLGDAVGIRAPSLYKHFPDKAAVETALINDGFEEIAARFEAALTNGGDSLVELAIAYQAFARAHPHLYRLMTAGPLPTWRELSGPLPTAWSSSSSMGGFPRARIWNWHGHGDWPPSVRLGSPALNYSTPPADPASLGRCRVQTAAPVPAEQKAWVARSLSIENYSNGWPYRSREAISPIGLRSFLPRPSAVAG
jgi:predicted DNA-binding transcriptional regulator AlpA